MSSHGVYDDEVRCLQTTVYQRSKPAPDRNLTLNISRNTIFAIIYVDLWSCQKRHF